MHAEATLLHKVSSSRLSLYTGAVSGIAMGRGAATPLPAALPGLRYLCRHCLCIHCLAEFVMALLGLVDPC